MLWGICRQRRGAALRLSAEVSSERLDSRPVLRVELLDLQGPLQGPSLQGQIPAQWVMAQVGPTAIAPPSHVHRDAPVSVAHQAHQAALGLTAPAGDAGALRDMFLAGGRCHRYLGVRIV